MVSLVTRQFETKYHNETVNTIFELDPGMTYANMRLINLSYNGGGDTYIPTTGVLSLIRRIQLMDGNVEIDALDNVHEMAKVKNLLSSNRSSACIKRYLQHSSTGYDLRKDCKYMRAVPGALQATDKKGYIELSMLLDFLASNPVFSFKNPRLVIEWNTDFNYTVSFPRNGGLTIPAPSLLVDQILDAKVKAPSKYMYRSWERDRVTIVATTGDPVQTVRARLNGFNKKLCGKGVIQLIPNVINSMEGAIVSDAQRNETYQLFLDNRPMLEGEGETLVSKQHRMHMLFGDMNIAYSQYNLQMSNEFSNDANNPCDPFFEPGLGQALRTHSCYGAVDFSQQRFNDLQIEYNRQRPAGGANLPQCTLALTVEVWKTCQFDSDGDAVVGYA